MVLPDRNRTGSLKFDGVVERFGYTDKSALPMWLADMDFPPPPVISETLNTYLSQCFGYQMGTVSGAVRNWYSRRGITVEEDTIVTCSSVLAGIAATIQTLTTPGDAIAVFSPTYGPLFSLVKDCDRTLVSVTIDETLTIRDVVASGQLPSHIKMVLLCNPNNPTGQLVHSDDMYELAQFCEHQRIPLVVDEVHSEFIRADCSFFSALSLSAHFRRSVVVAQSPNKAYNLAHLPAASYLVIANPKWYGRISSSLLRRHLCAGDLACVALTAAYDRRNDSWLAEVVTTINDNRQMAFDTLKHTSLMTCCPQSTYFLWLDLRLLFPTTSNVAGALFKATGIASNDGTMFDMPGFVRVNLATSSTMVKTALSRLVNLIHST